MFDKIVEKRPWGKFEQYIQDKTATVKVLTIYPNRRLSLQRHKNRDEYWVVLDGHPLITLRDKDYLTKPGEEFFIARGETHRITALSSLVRILEISTGEFDENDIVRLEDDYNRC